MYIFWLVSCSVSRNYKNLKQVTKCSSQAWTFCTLCTLFVLSNMTSWRTNRIFFSVRAPFVPFCLDLISDVFYLLFVALRLHAGYKICSLQCIIPIKYHLCHISRCSVQNRYCAILIQTSRVQRVLWPEKLWRYWLAGRPNVKAV